MAPRRNPVAAFLALAALLVVGLAGCIQVGPGADAGPDTGADAGEAATAPAPRIEVDFAWSPHFPAPGEEVTFEPRIRVVAGDSLDILRWDFGDGRQTNDNLPAHTFEQEGPATVRLDVQTTSGARGHVEHVLDVVDHLAVQKPGPASAEGGDGGQGGSDAAVPAPPPSVEILFEQEDNVVHLAARWSAAPDQVFWAFGDGTTSTEARPSHEYLSKGTFNVTVRGDVGGFIVEAAAAILVDRLPMQPHVVVGVPDSGINPYHEVYRRPELTEHPCTYIEDYPCNIPALELTLGTSNWHAAFEADRAKWEAIRPGDRYWIPGTNIIGAVCDQPYEGSTAGSTNPAGGVDHCILDDTSMHGTGTTSSVLSENPDALLVFVEGNSGGVEYLLDGTFPIDIVSYSWGAAVPLFVPLLLTESYAPFFVAASGNEGAFPVILDSGKQHPSVINVGGGDGATRTEPGYSSWKTADFVSQYCRPTAQTESIREQRDRYCGTSFSAPTFAGALSKVILELRRASGYTGSVENGMVDPILGISKADVRHAFNLSARYDPVSPFPAAPGSVPLAQSAPYYQWGWGYVSRNEVPAVLACLLEATCRSKDDATVAYMEALWTYRETMP
ncbi:MAG: PKD domain-containing protein [Thermoplasmatota archaeon]